MKKKRWVFCIKKPTIGITLRNWLTFLVRKCISECEREAFYFQGQGNVLKIKQKVLFEMAIEIDAKSLRYEHENKLANFEKIITQILCKKFRNEYIINNIFT